MHNSGVSRRGTELLHVFRARACFAF